MSLRTRSRSENAQTHGRARFQREAQVLANLNHPGIAAIYGIEKSDDNQALVLELARGRSWPKIT